MKKIGVLLVFVLVFALSFVYAAIPDDCDSNMVSYWKFDDLQDSSTIILDSLILNGGDITDSLNQIGPATGKLGSAINFRA